MDTKDKYEKYAVPKKPEDPDAPYLTVQETAYVFGCAVKTIRRYIKGGAPHSRVGQRIKLSREDRAYLYDLRRSGNAPAIRRSARPRKRAAAA